MNPTADDIAIAIVAACRETGDDPIAVAEGIYTQKKARHYALHALVYVFPKTNPHRLCVYVGCTGKPGHFWSNSLTAVVRPRNGRLHAAGWWDDAAYDRVIRAIEADRTRRNVAPRASAAPECVSEETEPPAYRPPPGTVEKALNGGAKPKLGTLEPAGYRPPPDTIKEMLAGDRPIFDRSPIHERPRFRPHEPKQSKADLEAELRQAVLNTIARQKVE